MLALTFGRAAASYAFRICLGDGRVPPTGVAHGHGASSPDVDGHRVLWTGRCGDPHADLPFEGLLA